MHIGSKQGLTQPKGLVRCLGQVQFKQVGLIQVSGQYRVKLDTADLICFFFFKY